MRSLCPLNQTSTPHFFSCLFHRPKRNRPFAHKKQDWVTKEGGGRERKTPSPDVRYFTGRQRPCKQKISKFLRIKTGLGWRRRKRRKRKILSPPTTCWYKFLRLQFRCRTGCGNGSKNNLNLQQEKALMFSEHGECAKESTAENAENIG